MKQGDTIPTESGLYVVYTNGPIKTVAERKLMMFTINSGWSYPFSDQRFRDHIYEWIGPLPVLELED